MADDPMVPARGVKKQPKSSRINAHKAAGALLNLQATPEIDRDESMVSESLNALSLSTKEAMQATKMKPQNRRVADIAGGDDMTGMLSPITPARNAGRHVLPAPPGSAKVAKAHRLSLKNVDPIKAAALQQAQNKGAEAAIRAAAEKHFQDSPYKAVRKLSESLEQNDADMIVQMVSNARSSLASDSLKNMVATAEAKAQEAEEQLRAEALEKIRQRRQLGGKVDIRSIISDELEQHKRYCFDQGIALLKECGQGGQASVYIGKALGQGGAEYAVKVQPISAKTMGQGFDEPTKFLLSMTPSQYICRIISMFDKPSLVDPDRIAFRYTISELCPGADALQYIIRRSHHPKWHDRCMSEEEVRPIIWGMLKSLADLHSRGAIHRDVKPENGMWDPKTKTFKLIDFGHMLLCRKDETIYRPNQVHGAGTRFYRAPESLLGYYSAACDAWGVGVSMFTLLFAYVPFQYYRGSELPPSEESNSVLRGFDPRIIDGVGAHFPKAIPCSAAALRLMAGLLIGDVQRRSSVERAMSSSWFREYHQ